MRHLAGQRTLNGERVKNELTFRLARAALNLPDNCAISPYTCFIVHDGFSSQAVYSCRGTKRSDGMHPCGRSFCTVDARITGFDWQSRLVTLVPASRLSSAVSWKSTERGESWKAFEIVDSYLWFLQHSSQ